MESQNRAIKKNLEIDMKFNEDFSPTKSQRNASKSIYTGAGRIRQSGLDACDCLNNDCIGCHFPCQNCKSSKCGNLCRKNRDDYIRSIRIDSGCGEKKIYNPNFKRGDKNKSSKN